MSQKRILVTGGAGFIGSNLCERLISKGYNVVALDNFNNYYNPEIKRRNIKKCFSNPNFRLYIGDIRDREILERIFKENSIQYVVHLAALAGVRPSLLSPIEYISIDVSGTVNLLEVVKDYKITKFVFGSSSSVYGKNSKIPFSAGDKLEGQVSPYAAAKRSGELFCATYNKLYDIPMGILRFFTVYGERQRPDMAIHKFVSLINEGREITIYGDGSSKRDYTYIGDVVDGIVRSLSFDYNFEIFNLGSGRVVRLMDLVQIIEDKVKKKTKIKFLPEQKGDVPITYADISKAKRLLDYNPTVEIEEGVERFVKWYLGEGPVK